MKGWGYVESGYVLKNVRSGVKVEDWKREGSHNELIDWDWVEYYLSESLVSRVGVIGVVWVESSDSYRFCPNWLSSPKLKVLNSS